MDPQWRITARTQYEILLMQPYYRQWVYTNEGYMNRSWVKLTLPRFPLPILGMEE
jgi:hypothetical protein